MMQFFCVESSLICIHKTLFFFHGLQQAQPFLTYLRMQKVAYKSQTKIPCISQTIKSHCWFRWGWGKGGGGKGVGLGICELDPRITFAKT
jgi:hypothetical protein